MTPKRRGKGAAVYIHQTDSRSLPASTLPVAPETGQGDVAADFVYVDVPPSRRARWMDADLAAWTDQRAFTCSLSRPFLDSLGDLFGRRATEGRSMPRRSLVDLSDVDEELVALDDDTDKQINSMRARSSHESVPRRLFLLVEDLWPFTSASGHVFCRFV